MQEAVVLVGGVVLYVLAAVGAYNLGASPGLAGVIPLAILGAWAYLWNKRS